MARNIDPKELVQQRLNSLKSKASSVADELGERIRTNFQPATFRAMGQNLLEGGRNLLRATPESVTSQFETSARNIPSITRSYQRNPASTRLGQFGVNFVLPAGQSFLSGIGEFSRSQLEDPSISNTIRGVRGLARAATPIAPISAPFFQTASAIAVTPQPTSFISPTMGRIKQPSGLQRFAAGALRGQTGLSDIASQVPEVKSARLFGTEFDPFSKAGEMVGFSQNPINKLLFKGTNKFIPTATKSVGTFLGTTASRGALEDIILSMPDLPENSNNLEKATFLLGNALFGAGGELAGTLGLEVAPAQARKQIQNLLDTDTGKALQKNLGEVYDALKNDLRLRAVVTRGNLQSLESLNKLRELGKAGNYIADAIEEARKNPDRGAVRFDLGLGADKKKVVVEDGRVKLKRPNAHNKVRVGERKLNINRLDLNSEQKALVEELSATLDDEVLKNVDVVALAKQVDPSGQAIGREATAKVIAQQLADRQKVVSLTKELDDLKLGGALEKDIADKIGEIAEASRISRKQGTSLGRQLQARTILANELDTPMQKVFKLLDTAGIDPEKYKLDAAKVDWNNANEVAKFYRKHVPASWWEILDEVRYSSMLSSPLTHAVNFSSNLIQLATQGPRKLFAGSYDWALSGMSKRERKRFASEATPYFKGVISSIPNAHASAMKAIRGETEITNLDMKRIPVGTKTSEVIRTPIKILEAGDVFFRTLLESGEQSSLKHRARLMGEELTPQVRARIAKQAENEALYNIFRGELNKEGQGWMLDLMDNMTSLILSSRNAGKLGKLSQLFIPFVQTPMNILKQGIEYSPAGFLNMIRSRGDYADQLGKATLGSMVMMTAASLVSTDNATWETPTNPKEKEEFYGAGRQPYSVKIGDKWYSYTKLGPLAYPIAAASALKHAVKNSKIEEKTKTETAIALGGMLGSFFADQSYMQGIGDILDAVRGDKFKATRLASNIPMQFVPFRAFMGWVTRLVDPVYRKTDWKGGIPQAIAESLMSQTPFISKNLPSYTNPFGEVSERDLPLVNAFSPVRISVEKEAGEKLFQSKNAERAIKKQERILKQQFEQAQEEGEAIASTDAEKLQTLFDVKDLTPSEGQSAFENAKREKKVFSKVDDILDSELIDDNQKTILLDSLGVTRPQAEYYNIARLTNDVKQEYVMEKIADIAKTTKDRGEMLRFLADNRREVNGKEIVSDGILSELEDIGLITADEKKQLKNLTIEPNGSYSLKTTGRGAGARIKKVTPVKPGKVRVTLNRPTRIRAPRISQQDLQKIMI